MSFITSLITGYLNTDADIMEGQREYEREQEEKKRLLAEGLNKETRAFNKELLKKQLDASYNTQKQYLKDVAAGNIKPVKVKTKAGFLTAMDMFGINQSYISKGMQPIYNVPSLYERIEKAETFGTMIGKGINSFNYASKYQTDPNPNNASALLNQIGTTGLNESELARLKKAPK